MKHLTRFTALGLSASLLAIAAGCEPQPSELAPAGAGAGAAGAGRAGDSWKGQPAPWDVKPSPATVTPPPPQLSAQASPSPSAEGVEETHGVTSPDRCDTMAEKFKRQGRRVTLKEKRSNPSGGVLTWICVFTGEDATPGYFDGDR